MDIFDKFCYLDSKKIKKKKKLKLHLGLELQKQTALCCASFWSTDGTKIISLASTLRIDGRSASIPPSYSVQTNHYVTKLVRLELSCDETMRHDEAKS